MKDGSPNNQYDDPILRIVRRLSYESLDVLKKTEGLHDGQKLDLEPSAYVVPDHVQSGAVRMHAEHVTVLRNAPGNTPRHHVDARALPFKGLLEEPGQPNFEFTRNAHVCLSLADERDVHAFSAALYAMVGSGATVTVAQLKAYVESRDAAGDPEWQAFFEHPDRKKDWKKWRANR